MRILGLVRGQTHVCARYRLAAFRPFFEKEGHELEVYSWSEAWWSRFHLPREARSADVVVVQRRLLTREQLRPLRGAARSLVFDFDDAVFSRDSYDARGPYCPRRLRRFVRMVRAADVVLAGNPFLRDQACLWTSPTKVFLAPTCVDPERYPRAAHLRRSEGVNLVWIGSSSTLRGLEKIRGILEFLGKKQTGLNLKVICDRSIFLRALPVRFAPWSEQSEAAELAAADIGISWLPADDWSRGKCGLKVLQYMAAGLPVVANPVGMQAELVRPGENGFLVESAADWLQAIQVLANDPGLRRRLGEAGRQRVEREFSIARGTALWRDILKTLSRLRVTASRPA